MYWYLRAIYYHFDCCMRFDIAYPQHGSKYGFTVSYTDGPEQNPEGRMSKGTVVFVKHKMKFDVTPTKES